MSIPVAYYSEKWFIENFPRASPLLSLLLPPFSLGWEKYAKRGCDARLPTDRRVIVKTEPTFTTVEYSQPLITSFAPWLVPSGSLSRVSTTYGLLYSRCYATWSSATAAWPFASPATTQFRSSPARHRPWEGWRKWAKWENDAANRWSSRRILTVASVFMLTTVNLKGALFFLLC